MSYEIRVLSEKRIVCLVFVGPIDMETHLKARGGAMVRCVKEGFRLLLVDMAKSESAGISDSDARIFGNSWPQNSVIEALRIAWIPPSCTSYRSLSEQSAALGVMRGITMEQFESRTEAISWLCEK